MLIRKFEYSKCVESDGMIQEVMSNLVWHIGDETPNIEGDGEYLVITHRGELFEAEWRKEGYWYNYKYHMPVEVKAWCNLSDIKRPTLPSMPLKKRR